MTPATGLHGVTLAHVPGIGMAPKVKRAPITNQRPMLHSGATAMIRCILVMTERYQTTAAIADKAGRCRNAMGEVLIGLRGKGLIESMKQGGGKYALWRLTPAGEAEQQWHRRQG